MRQTAAFIIDDNGSCYTADTRDFATALGLATPLRDGPNSGSDIARRLSHHGCQVVVQQFPSGGVEIGQAILEGARELSIDLIVMGAYQHSRMREMILGGTTRTMIEQGEIPVLLAH